MNGNKGKKVGISTYISIAVYVFLTQFFNIFENTGAIMFSFIGLFGYGIAWIIRKIVSESFEPLNLAFSMQLSFVIVTAVAAVSSGLIGPALPDLVMMGIGLLWLIAKPGIAPVVLLTVLNGGGMLIQIYVVAVNGTILGSTVDYALLMAFRAVVIYLMIQGLRRYRKSFIETEKLVPADEPEGFGM